MAYTLIEKNLSLEKIKFFDFEKLEDAQKLMRKLYAENDFVGRCGDLYASTWDQTSTMFEWEIIEISNFVTEFECDSNVHRYWTTRRNAASIPVYENEVWKDYTVLEDSPSGQEDVKVMKFTPIGYSISWVYKNVLFPDY